MTAPPTYLVCGCVRGLAHTPGCRLGQAEHIAVAAAAARPRGQGRQLLAAMSALAQAGLLDDLAPHGLGEDVAALVDTPWEMQVITDAR